MKTTIALALALCFALVPFGCSSDSGPQECDPGYSRCGQRLCCLGYPLGTPMDAGDGG